MTYKEAADIIQKILDSRKTYFNEVLGTQISNFVLAGTDNVSEALALAHTCIDYTYQVGQLHDCNDCAGKGTCPYEPKPGEWVRINCPLWYEEKRNV